MSTETFQIGLRENRTAFEPGDEIDGAVHWELEEAPTSAEVRLCWYTRGKGSVDEEVIKSIPLGSLQPGDVRKFSFRAPNAPYSFSGKLISLIWCVELVLQPGDRFVRQDIVIAPSAKEVVLPGAG